MEPGLIRTGFGGAVAESLAGSAAPTGPDAALNTSAEQQVAATYRSARPSAPLSAVAKVIDHAVTASRPRSRYVVTPAAKALVHTRRLLGGRAFDAYLRRQFRPTG